MDKMVVQKRRQNGMTVVELLVVISIVGLLAGLLLPAVQQSRESARRMQCKNRLKQIGLAALAYHDLHKTFPPGYIGENLDPSDRQGWGWAALMLPFIEEVPLHTELGVTPTSLGSATGDAARVPPLQTSLVTFLCPSDNTETSSHTNRRLAALGALGLSRRSFFHPGHVPGASIAAAKSNYVGSFGDGWDPKNGFWPLSRLRGNGVFGCNTGVRLSQIRDGSSNTFAAGERSWDAFAAVWVGVDRWSECSTYGVSMVLGTVFYQINSDPRPFPLSCDGRGSAGFTSRHPGGAQFVMCDGSVRFVSETIDFQNSPIPSNLGVYQRLGQRSDGVPIERF